MSDLISRQAAIDAICKACANGDDYVECVERRPESTFCDEIVALRKLPSAQPDRKKEKWIEKEYSPFYCSVCGTYQYSASWEIKNKEYNFCPRCGADMRGESE